MHVKLDSGRLASRGRDVLQQVLGLLQMADKSAEESPRRTGLGGDFSWCPGLLGGRPGWTGREGWLPPPPRGCSALPFCPEEAKWCCLQSPTGIYFFFNISTLHFR